MKKIFMSLLVVLSLGGMCYAGSGDTLCVAKYTFVGDSLLNMSLTAQQLACLQPGDSCLIKSGEETKTFVGHWYWWKFKVEATDGYCFLNKNYVCEAKYIHRIEYSLYWFRMAIVLLFFSLLFFTTYSLLQERFFSWVEVMKEKRMISSINISGLALFIVVFFLTPFSLEPSLVLLKIVLLFIVVIYVLFSLYLAIHPIGKKMRAYAWPFEAKLITLGGPFLWRDYLIRTNGKDTHSDCLLVTFEGKDIHIFEVLSNYSYDTETRVLSLYKRIEGHEIDKIYSFAEKRFIIG